MGASGMKAVFFKTILQSKNENAKTGIIKMIQLIARGGLDDKVNEKLNVVRQVLLKKPNGTFRRIGISEPLVAIADNLISRMISPTLKEVSTDSQFGLKEDGCQLAAVAAQIELDRMTDLGLEVAILHVDMKSAFDTVKREAILQLLKSTTHSARFFVDRLSQPTSLEFDVGEGTLQCATSYGVPQGAATSPIVFDAVYGKCLKECGVLLTDTNGRTLLIHDDYYCVALVSELEKVVSKMKGEKGVNSIGLELQERKSEYC